MLNKLLEIINWIKMAILENDQDQEQTETSTPAETLENEGSQELGQSEQAEPQETPPQEEVPSSPEHSGDIFTVVDANDTEVRKYSTGIHGEDAEKLAQSFALKIGGIVK